MTIQELIDLIGNHPKYVLSYFISLGMLSLVGLLLVRQRDFKPPLSYLYGILIYATTIPGLLSLVLLLYNFFFLKANLLTLNFTTYYIPLLSMILILIIVNKTIPIKHIPGFGRLSGLFMIIMITFITTYILQKMFFGVLFIGKIQYLILLFIILFIGIKFAWNRLIK